MLGGSRMTAARAALAAMPRGERLLAVAVLAAALVARLGAIAATSDYVPRVDDRSYDEYARSIAATGGYPDSIFAPAGGESAFWPPGYPYFLAAIHKLLGHGWDTARLVQALVGVATVALVGVLAWQLIGRRGALAAAAIAAVHPPLVLLSATLYTEVLFVPLLLAAVVAALEQRRSPGRLALPALVGALAGLAILTRPVGLFALVPLAFALWRRGEPLRGLRAPAAMALAVALVLAPWVVRNAATLGEPTLSTNLSYVVAGTYNETARNDEEFPAAWRPPNLVAEHADLLDPRSGLDERELAARFRERALDHVADHPLYPLRVAWLNALRSLDLYGGHERARRVYAEQGFGPRAADAAILGFYALALAALAGAFTAAARRAPRWVWAVPLLIVLGAVVGQGVSRYRVPADPFLIVLAAAAALAAADRLRARGRAEAPV